MNRDLNEDRKELLQIAGGGAFWEEGDIQIVFPKVGTSYLRVTHISNDLLSSRLDVRGSSNSKCLKLLFCSKPVPLPPSSMLLVPQSSSSPRLKSWSCVHQVPSQVVTIFFHKRSPIFSASSVVRALAYSLPVCICNCSRVCPSSELGSAILLQHSLLKKLRSLYE